MTNRRLELIYRIRLIGALLMWLPAFVFGESSTEVVSPLTYSVGGHYSEGKYTQQETSSLTYVPITMKYKTPRYQVKVSLPWLLLHGAGNEEVTGQANNGTNKVRGMGDVILQYKHYMPYQSWLASWVDVGLKLKLPTADEKKGLGSGQADFTFSIDTLTPYQSAVLFSKLGYRVRNDSDSVDYENGAIVEAGIMQKWNNNRPGILFSHRESAFSERDLIQEVMLFNKTLFQHHRSLFYYIGAGLTDNSSDWMLGISLEFP